MYRNGLYEKERWVAGEVKVKVCQVLNKIMIRVTVQILLQDVLKKMGL